MTAVSTRKEIHLKLLEVSQTRGSRHVQHIYAENIEFEIPPSPRVLVSVLLKKQSRKDEDMPARFGVFPQVRRT